ncbi:hypothetical protein [Streptomyces sp. NPDC088246]|uniref:hypothetical protein n=1 Tax=Streptomyces sp. NPDC088246 TaxID=3365842 RepID=UPI0037F849E4
MPLLLKAARSSYCAWLAVGKNRALRQAADQALAHEITVIHLASRKTYGRNALLSILGGTAVHVLLVSTVFAH